MRLDFTGIPLSELSSFCLVLLHIGLRLGQPVLVTLEVGLVFLDLGTRGAELRRILIEFVLVPGGSP